MYQNLISNKLVQNKGVLTITRIPSLVLFGVFIYVVVLFIGLALSRHFIKSLFPVFMQILTKLFIS